MEDYLVLVTRQECRLFGRLRSSESFIQAEIYVEKKARRFLAIWCRDAWESGIKQLADVAKTLASYRTGLLTYFKHRITSGPVEGLVNKIKTLQRQAYGFRDMEYFKLRLYHLHTQRYALTG